MGEVVELEAYRPHVLLWGQKTYPCGKVEPYQLIVPVSLLQNLASGRLRLSKLHNAEPILRAVIGHYLQLLGAE